VELAVAPETVVAVVLERAPVVAVAAEQLAVEVVQAAAEAQQFVAELAAAGVEKAVAVPGQVVVETVFVVIDKLLEGVLEVFELEVDELVVAVAADATGAAEVVGQAQPLQEHLEHLCDSESVLL